jgi:hypothetical protein
VVRGAWCVVRGAWCVVRGAWCVVRGAWCVVRAWCVWGVRPLYLQQYFGNLTPDVVRKVVRVVGLPLLLDDALFPSSGTGVCSMCVCRKLGCPAPTLLPSPLDPPGWSGTCGTMCV